MGMAGSGYRAPEEGKPWLRPSRRRPRGGKGRSGGAAERHGGGGMWGTSVFPGDSLAAGRRGTRQRGG
jgi:hypothetical protein